MDNALEKKQIHGDGQTKPPPAIDTALSGCREDLERLLNIRGKKGNKRIGHKKGQINPAYLSSEKSRS